MKPTNNVLKGIRLAVIIPLVGAIVLSLLFYSHNAEATPVGASITVIGNSTINSTPESATDQGGYIYTYNLNGLQQNTKWKAYVGNVTGAFTLDDSDGNTIYDWTIPDSQISGEVYVSVNDSISWSTINCSNQSAIELANNFFGYSATATDTINETFNLTIHDAFQIGTVAIPADNCSSLITFVNDTYQNESSSTAVFEEIVLADSLYSVVFAQNIEQDTTGYINGTTYDYQMIVPENGTSPTGSTYYFYVEIG